MKRPSIDEEKARYLILPILFIVSIFGPLACADDDPPPDESAPTTEESQEPEVEDQEEIPTPGTQFDVPYKWDNVYAFCDSTTRVYLTAGNDTRTASAIAAVPDHPLCREGER